MLWPFAFFLPPCLPFSSFYLCFILSLPWSSRLVFLTRLLDVFVCVSQLSNHFRRKRSILRDGFVQRRRLWSIHRRAGIIHTRRRRFVRGGLRWGSTVHELIWCDVAKVRNVKTFVIKHHRKLNKHRKSVVPTRRQGDRSARASWWPVEGVHEACADTGHDQRCTHDAKGPVKMADYVLAVIALVKPEGEGDAAHKTNNSCKERERLLRTVRVQSWINWSTHRLMIAKQYSW